MFRFEIKWITTCKAAIAACEEWQQRKKLQDSLLVNVHLYHQRLQKELRMQMEYIMHFYLYSRLCVVSATSWVTRPEESYRLWCVVVSDLETSWMRRTWSTEGAVAPKTNKQTNKPLPKSQSVLTAKKIKIYKTLTLRLLMSYIYGAHILDVSRSHTTTQYSR